MEVHIRPGMPATPIRVNMSYAEALNIAHALKYLVPQGMNYPNTNKLLELLQRVIDDPYFD